jgi:plastocyanin
MTRIFIIALLMIATAACDAGESQPREPIGVNTVTLSDSRFTPADITVEPGTEVTWIWDDGSRSHDVVGDGFASDTQTEGTFTHTFTEPGTYEYVCTLHQGMEGTVTVTESTS